MRKIKETEEAPCGARLVGLYGMSGVGKTTICKVLRNQKFLEFGGRVCHVELGSQSCVELQRGQVIRELTDFYDCFSEWILSDPTGEVFYFFSFYIYTSVA